MSVRYSLWRSLGTLAMVVFMGQSLAEACSGEKGREHIDNSICVLPLSRAGEKWCSNQRGLWAKVRFFSWVKKLHCISMLTIFHFLTSRLPIKLEPFLMSRQLFSPFTYTQSCSKLSFATEAPIPVIAFFSFATTPSKWRLTFIECYLPNSATANWFNPCNNPIELKYYCS